MTTPPPRLPLARLPTPLERLERLGSPLGLDLWVKRDDLTGTAISGNKVRKLEYLVADAAARGTDVLVTCGAVGSNHARATAVAAARCGMRSHLVLRGEDRDPPDGNLLLDRVLGSRITFIPPDAWPQRDVIMAQIVGRLAIRGQMGYAIPEGGSNALGCMGYVRGAAEILEQADHAGLDVRRIVHATGSGGTTAGLALGIAQAGRDDIEVLGVAVCDDRAYFDRRIGGICDDAASAGYVSEAVRERARWTILEGYKGQGYARTTPGEMRTIAEAARTEGLFLDPVYTGKAFGALQAEATAGRMAPEGTTIFLHTGGLFGLFAFAPEIRALDDVD